MGSGDLKLDKEKRTLEFPFSSELPVERYFGKEVLSHDAAACDMSRIKGGAAPLLFNHDPDNLIGVVEDGSISADRRGYARVKFSKSAAGQQAMQDVEDGIIRNVSFGYQIKEMVETKRHENGEREFTATSWSPFEISLVSIPADHTVGIGRAAAGESDYEVRVLDQNGVEVELKTEKKPIENLGGKRNMEIENKPEIKIDASKVAADAVSAERARSAGISTLAANLAARGIELGDLARQCIDSGKSLEEFRGAALEKVGVKATPVRGDESDIGMSKKEVREFSFVKVLRALADRKDGKISTEAGFEMEVSEAAQKKNGKTARGFLIPTDVLRQKNERALSVGSSTAGGNLVSTDLVSGSFIDLLRNRMAVQQLGATVLNGLNGNIAIPRQTGGATAYWVAEAGAVTTSSQAFDQVTMSPKSVGAYTDYSRKLLLQSSIDVEQMVRMDLAKVIALELDRAALYGLGSSNQPTGIKATSGIATKDFAAATPTWLEIIELETKVAAANADLGSLAYLTNATLRGALKGVAKATNQAIFVWENDMMNGYKAVASNQVASGDVFFANWSDLLIGFWSGLDLTLDPYANSTSGGVRIVALQDCDIAVRHAESFCRGNDSL
jgi:HK97 family phage major capsid protein/HK97 family phage prohead protease